MITTLDLFSGIGGFAYALRGVTKTVAYCDSELACHKVIKANISRGNLDAAPIFENVKDIDKSLLDTRLSLQPCMITAGFPCTDISIANVHGMGLQGDRSSLFFEIMRIVDICPSIEILFLENSHAIVRRGLKGVERALHKRGFRMTWCIITALDVGALHRRKRWYCLCTRGNGFEKLIAASPSNTFYNWKKEKCVRMLPKPTARSDRLHMTDRCRMLGNSIVPQCAAYAWNSLIKFHLTIKGQVHVTPLRNAPSLNLVMCDGKKTFEKQHWATPCYSIWHIYSSITSSRAKTVLTNQIYYELKTRLENLNHEREKTEHYRKYLCNPQFIEFLMGFPRNWTFVKK